MSKARPSSIVLSDPECVWSDEKAKSISFFCRNSPVRVDTELVNQLKAVSAQNRRSNVRVCLHEGPDAVFHEMIILECRGKYYRPHKHLSKPESYHIIEGSMAAFIFDEGGEIIDFCVLGQQGNIAFRVGTNMYHSVMPLSEVVIYHESKPGPFLGENDSIYAVWAPDGSDPGAISVLQKKLADALTNI